ncbi:hypothetical protein [Ideonella sp.]|uniref:hypothetical protein n=1 Tax=Ideonella sp. TaxID=1929293 RepID=UPI003BB59769
MIEIAALIFLLGFYALDPVLTWAKKRFLGRSAAPFRPPLRIYRALVWVLPSSAAFSCTISYAFLKLSLLAAVFVLVMSLFLARYFQNRAESRLAWLPRMRVDPADPDHHNDLYDLIAALSAVALVAMPLLAPLMAGTAAR